MGAYVVRRSSGHGIAEFAPSLSMLFVALFLLGDAGMLLLRYVVAKEMVEHSVRQMAESESFTEAQQELDGPDKLRERLTSVGVKPVNLELRMVANSLTRANEQPLVVSKTGGIPAPWLPNGKQCPCNYNLELDAQVEISPGVVMTVPPNVPGLSAPVPYMLSASERWENRTRNPVTKGYYLNE